MSLLDAIAKAAAARKAEEDAKASAQRAARQELADAQRAAFDAWMYRVRPAIREYIGKLNEAIRESGRSMRQSPERAWQTEGFPFGPGEKFCLTYNLSFGPSNLTWYRFALETVSGPDVAVVALSCDPPHVRGRRLVLDEKFNPSTIEHWLQEAVSASLKLAA